jgi:hypothetical protein
MRRYLHGLECTDTVHADARSLVVWRAMRSYDGAWQKLALQWSPEQVSGWLKRQFPADQGMQISHEPTYQSLFIQTRGAEEELMAHLRTARQMRQAKGGPTKSGLGQIVDTVSIRDRRPTTAPCQATGRATFSAERTTRTS